MAALRRLAVLAHCLRRRALPSGFAGRSKLCWCAKKIVLFSAPAAMGVNCCIPVHFAAQRLRLALYRVIIRNQSKSSQRFVLCEDFDLVGI
jgi:hypothetical protein